MTSHRAVVAVALAATLWGCGGGAEVTRVEARPGTPTIAIEPGEHALGLGGLLVINFSTSWRDGTLYIPRVAMSGEPLPLLVLLHGGGGRASDFRHTFPLAEELGVVIVTLDARHNTWDGIDSPFGPDVLFIDAALRHTFDRVSIDPAKVGLGGLSDGGAYALAVGRTNGDLFTHLVAVAPGLLSPPAPPTGQPRILVAHGTRDNVYPVFGTKLYIVPRLKSSGYDVTYVEFDGPHWMPADTARQVLEWLVQ